MINFKQLSARNFLSYGNVPTVWELDKYPTTLIVGSNGSGKSCILDAVCFALFGKPYRNINKPQLVNSINQKNCVVELNMTVNGVPYKIIRGIKPNLFEIHQDGKMIDQEAAMKDMQEYLEVNIIKMNFRTFCQVVILGSAGFTPFMKLTTAARREVIEDVLDIGIFSKMNSVLKDRIAATKEETKLVTVQLDGVKKETESQKRIIDLIKKNQTTRVAELQADISDLNKQLQDCKTRLDYNQALLSQLDHDTYSRNNSEYESIQGKIQDAKFESNQLLSKIKKITSMTSCPSCLQGISHEHKDTIQEQFSKDIEKYTSMIEELTPKMDQLFQLVSSYEKQKTECDTLDIEIKREAGIILQSIKEKKLSIQRIESDTGDIELETQKLKTIASEAVRLIQREKELKEEKQLQDISQILLKDGGIKTAIIKEYLPVLNNLINKYLSAFDFFVNFNLDENFSEVIKSRGRDEFSYASFSEGEKKRLDLAILLAFRQIAAMKNSAKVNLLIMDEVVDSSLDLDARVKFTELLDTMKDSNVIVISHTDTAPDAYSSVIQVEKKGDFSFYSYI